MGVAEALASLPPDVYLLSAIDVFHSPGGFSPPRQSISATFLSYVIEAHLGLLTTTLPTPTRLASSFLYFATSNVADLDALSHHYIFLEY